MRNEWDNIGSMLKSSLGKYQEGEPIDPWQEFEKRVKRSNFFKFSLVTFNIYYFSIMIIFAFGAGFTTYKVINYNHQLIILNNLIAHGSDSINKHSNNKIANNQTRKMTDSVSITSLKKDNSKISSLHQNELAANIEESALFEGLIASNYRSNDMKVSFPPLNHTFNSGQTIVFKINSDISKPIVLILFNNKGEEIIEKNNISNNRLLINNRLSPGLYYWKLLKGRDLIQVGKFFMK